MQIASIALVCFLSAGAVAIAAEMPAPAPATPPQPPVGSPPYPPAPPPYGQGPLALPGLEPTHEPDDRAQTPAAPANAARRSDPPHGRTCFSQGESREKIVAHKLADPFHALRSGHFQGDALRARLCRWHPDEFVYEISVLRRDGRIAHVYMNAATGQAVQAPSDSDRK